MSKSLNWGKSVAALALAFSSLGVIPAQAQNSYNNNQANVSTVADFQLAQASSLRGQCMFARNEIFIQRAPGTSRARLQPFQRVILAEDTANNGWVAISSPVVGFVETRYLEFCNGNNNNNFNPDLSSNLGNGVINTPPPGFSNQGGFPPNPLLNRNPVPPLNSSIPFFPPATNNGQIYPDNSAFSNNSALCREVRTGGKRLMIRREPNRNSSIVDRVVNGNQVFLTSNPPDKRRDGTGREWVRVASPSPGWVSTGYDGDSTSNLAFCSF